MIFMRILMAAAMLAATVFSVPAIAATRVDAVRATPTSLGSFAAGRYRITATGLIDLSGAPGSGRHGQAGAGFKLGSLVGSFVANPVAGSFFTIGFETMVTLAAPGSLFALVNDTGGNVNNGGAFLVDVNAVRGSNAVPEPASWAMLIVGFGLMGALQRRQRIVAA
jgi:PEP-CTERM motif